jgi:hypothetical protein
MKKIMYENGHFFVYWHMTISNGISDSRYVTAVNSDNSLIGIELLTYGDDEIIIQISRFNLSTNFAYSYQLAQVGII